MIGFLLHIFLTNSTRASKRYGSTPIQRERKPQRLEVQVLDGHVKVLVHHVLGEELTLADGGAAVDEVGRRAPVPEPFHIRIGKLLVHGGGPTDAQGV